MRSPFLHFKSFFLLTQFRLKSPNPIALTMPSVDLLYNQGLHPRWLSKQLQQENSLSMDCLNSNCNRVKISSKKQLHRVKFISRKDCAHTSLVLDPSVCAQHRCPEFQPSPPLSCMWRDQDGLLLQNWQGHEGKSLKWTHVTDSFRCKNQILEGW